MSVLHQITRRRGVVERVPRGEEPVVELHLEPGSYIVAFEIREAAWVRAERKTTDWAWTAIVAHPLPPLTQMVEELDDDALARIRAQWEQVAA